MDDDIDFDFFDSPVNEAIPDPLPHHQEQQKSSHNNGTGDGTSALAASSSSSSPRKSYSSDVQRHSNSDSSKRSVSSSSSSNAHYKSSGRKGENSNSHSYNKKSSHRLSRALSKKNKSKRRNSSFSSSSSSSNPELHASLKSDDEYDCKDSDMFVRVARKFPGKLDNDTNLQRKPPLPSASNSSRHSSHRNSLVEDESHSLLAPGSTFYTSDGRKMRKGRCRYSDEEIYDSDCRTSDEEALSNNYRDTRPKRDSHLKIRLEEFVSPRSPSPDSQKGLYSGRRSRSNSSEWSTGNRENCPLVIYKYYSQNNSELLNHRYGGQYYLCRNFK